MALRIEQQIARLKISVQEVSRVHVLQAFQVLVDDVLLVDVFEDIGSDNSMQVSIHEVEDEVDIAIVLRANHILKPNNVLVTRQLLQKDDFTERALRICCILESVEILLQSDNLLGTLVNCLPDNTIGSLTYRQINVQAMTASLSNKDESVGALEFKI